MGLLDKSYPDTYKGGQECRKDVDGLRVILHGKEPDGYSGEFLRGFRNSDYLHNSQRTKKLLL